MFTMVRFVTLFHQAVLQGIPILYGSTGEILTEKSGHLNLGIPGVMYFGAISGVIGAFLYENNVPTGEALNPVLAILIPMLSAMLGSLLMGLIYCFLTVSLRANQNVTGLAITTFGVGFGNFFGASLVKITKSEVPSLALPRTSLLFQTQLPFADKLGVFGQLFMSFGFMTYLGILIAILAALFLRKTRTGLHLRAVGENPATADAAGINVNRYKYSATCIGSMIAGLGGLFYVLDASNGIWANGAFGDRGWLAIALVIFVVWRPDHGVPGSIVFGFLYISYLFIDGLPMRASELFKMAPYIVTIIVLILTSVRKNREHQPPASLGLSYFREER